MDGQTPKTPGYLLVIGFYMSKFLKKGLRVHGHSFPKAKILVSQNFYSFSAKFFFHYFHDIQIFINFIRLEEFDFLNLTLT